jgi:integrase
MDRHAAARIVHRTAIKAGLDDKKISPHTLRHAFITAALDAGRPAARRPRSRLARRPRTTMRYDRARAALDRHAAYIVAAYLAGAAR